jgi:hypothetical protein
MKTVPQQRPLKQIPRQMILPPWALQIDAVRQTDTDLVVSGNHHFWFQRLKRDPYGDWVTDILSGFDEDRKVSQIERSNAPHIIFASAHTLPEQVAFVQRFGPVLASKIHYGDHDTVIAHQNLKTLSFEQQLFSRIFDLTRLVNELTLFSWNASQGEKEYGKRWVIAEPGNDIAFLAKEVEKRAKDFDAFLKEREILTSGAHDELGELRALVSEIDELMNPSSEDHSEEPYDSSSWRNLSSPLYAKEQMSQESSLDVFDLANELLCNVFNRFPVTLCYSAGMAHDLPEMNPSGIRSVLYYMLRLEYLYQNEIRLCAHPYCGWYFLPGRTNRDHCSLTCYDNHKSQRSRDRKKAKLAAQGKAGKKRASKSRVQRAQQGGFKLRESEKPKTDPHRQKRSAS